MRVHFRFRRADLDDLGVLTPESLRRLARVAWDVPANMTLLIDLGPCRQVQHQLVRDLSLYRCARSVEFSGPDWRAVLGHTRALSRSLAAVAS